MTPAARSLAAVAAILLAGATELRAWGFTAHRMVNARAVETLPEPLRAFYRANAEWIAEHAIDPDLDRDRSDDPDHFLDMDAFGAWPFPDIAADEAAHLRRFGAEAREKGRVPWRVREDYDRLVAAFRARDAEAVLRASAALGHLIADAHVPLHAAQNHDGQLTGQRGLHSRWESRLVERFRRQVEPAVAPAAASPIADPVAFTFAVLRDSYLHSLEVLAADRAVAGPRDLAETAEDERYDDAYFSRLFEREGARLSARLGASAAAAGSLWLTAWEEAGRPEPDATFRMRFVRGKSRAVLASLDGLGAAIVEDAIARGVMPRLAALKARGASARGTTSALPTKTAPGHAALYTGAWSDRNGISGNQVPVAGGSILDTESGFSATALAAEPIWYAAARQDLDAVVVSATNVFPFSVYTEDRRFRGFAGRRLTLFDGYQGVEAGDDVVAAPPEWAPPANLVSALPEHRGDARATTFDVAGATVDAWAFDDPRDPVEGLDTIVLATDGDPGSGVTLKPSAPRDDASAFARLEIPLAGGEAAVFFRLHELAADGSRMLLWRSAPHSYRSSKPRLDAAALRASGGFVGNGASDAYDDGKLGPKLWDGGDGTAEARYAETAALVARQIERLDDFAIDGTDWDLLATYLPYPDEALHLWHGRLDPALPGHDPVVARRLRPYMDRVLATVDRHIGALADKAGPEAIVVIATDHGMSTAARVFKPNVALAQAGLLVTDASGRIDLSRTRAVYFAGNTGHVRVNRAALPGGIVSPAEEATVRRQAAATLTAAVDPQTGRSLSVRVFDLHAPRPGETPSRGRPEAGDLFVEIGVPGFALSAGTAGAVVEAIAPAGAHYQEPASRPLQGTLVFAGPGIPAGADLGLVRQIDIAPTLAALLGMDPLRDAEGKPIETLLQRMSLTKSLVYEDENGHGNGISAR